MIDEDKIKLPRSRRYVVGTDFNDWKVTGMNNTCCVLRVGGIEYTIPIKEVSRVLINYKWEISTLSQFANQVLINPIPLE